ncbi:MAG: hypothetical protein ABI405_07055 [Parafilimonas sp.]
MSCHKISFCIISGLIILFFTACTPTGYFISPMYGNSTPHHTTPMQTDSTKNTWYLNTAFSPGYNNNSYDYTFAGQANIYRANTFNHFNIYYGSGITLGNYNADLYYSSKRYNNPNLTSSTDHFFGSLNVNGGLNFVIPFNQTGEWRVLGLHTSLQQEFGGYLNFRKGFNPDSVDGVAKSSFLNTVGLSSELAFNLPRNIKLGGFLQYNFLIGTEYKDIYFGENLEAGITRYQYISLGFFMGFKRYMFFIQSNNGDQMFSASFGMNYRLRR